MGVEPSWWDCCPSVLSCLSHVWLFATSGTIAHKAPLSMGFSSRNTGKGCQVLLQGIFPTQGSNPHVLHCRQIFYCWATGRSPWCPSRRIKKQSTHSICHVKMKQKMAIYKLRHRFSADTKSPSTSISWTSQPKNLRNICSLSHPFWSIFIIAAQNDKDICGIM